MDITDKKESILPIDLNLYVDGCADIESSCLTIQKVRSGRRTFLKPDHNGRKLSRYIGGKLPYHYRSPEKIGEDFGAEHDALEMIWSLFAQAPTSPKFQNSHCAEILSSVYLEEVLGYRKLYSKLTLTSSENTNVHKMDGFFVKTDGTEFEYLLVEAKSSILPTEKTKFSGHRHGILKQMLESIDGYAKEDERFDFAKIRDNLSTSFSTNEARQIKRDLIPPGPIRCSFLGVAVVNSSTVHSADDDFILSSSISYPFEFSAIVVDDLATLARESYHYGKSVMDAIAEG
ncbi:MULTISPECIES: Hachiman antiphage defense system protein HamA [Pseudomonas]|uniref:Hachiman antiphage defense system protein HamA n=1 Tax=Pseudomonas TaxID=286 RepID=UPI0018CD4FA7|nr:MULTISPECIES: Hachiman antiphage defense system protein HamA [Pseudomonas]